MGQVVLQYLNKRAVIDSVMLADKLGYPVSTASVMLTRLFKRGLVDRCSFDHDKHRYFAYWAGGGKDYGGKPPHWVASRLDKHERENLGAFGRTHGGTQPA